MNTLQLFDTCQAYVFTRFLRSWTQDYEYKKQTEQNYLNGWAFAIVFIRAEHVSILFNIDLWLWAAGQKVFISEKIIDIQA